MTAPQTANPVTPLSQETLPDLEPLVAVPSYDRTALTPGIVHIGVGNFHRAHQAVYLDRLFEMGDDHDWALIGAGIQPNDAAIRADLKTQDWLTTVVELDPNGLKARVCGAMIDYAPVDPKALLATLSNSEIRIVSLTVTEGGYFIDATTGGFQSDHPDVRYDIEHPDQPRTVFGILCEALRQRRAENVPPFTIMSCDNLPENGKVTAQAMTELAAATDPDFLMWLRENVAFPSGMVDCITPVTSQRERDLLRQTFGIDDARPVTCEPFRQWVLEDNFPAGRPALERVGVEFVDDVAPYELMKLRILNGGHAAIAYPSALLGHRYVDEAMTDPLIFEWLSKLEQEEIIPSTPAVPGIDFDDYFKKVAERFSNPNIGDTVFRLCRDGSNRQPKFILPIVHERLAAGQPVKGLAMEVALWCRYCAGEDENGKPIGLDDDKAATLNAGAIAARHDPLEFLEVRSIFGSLSQEAAFAEPFSQALNRLWNKGTRDTLHHYLNG